MEPDQLTDDRIVAYLRDRAPGLPLVRFDSGTVTARARGANRRRRLVVGGAAMAVVTAASAGFALAGPLGGSGDGPAAAGASPGASTRRQLEADRLAADVLPVIQELDVDYYMREPGPACRILEYARGDFRDGVPACLDLVPFDPQARADFDRVTDAVRRSDVDIERIFRSGAYVFVQLNDASWEYNWEYVYRPGTVTPPPPDWPGEEWTHIDGDWWFHRAHDD